VYLIVFKQELESSRPVSKAAQCLTSGSQLQQVTTLQAWPWWIAALQAWSWWITILQAWSWWITDLC